MFLILFRPESDCTTPSYYTQWRRMASRPFAWGSRLHTRNPAPREKLDGQSPRKSLKQRAMVRADRVNLSRAGASCQLLRQRWPDGVRTRSLKTARVESSQLPIYLSCPKTPIYVFRPHRLEPRRESFEPRACGIARRR